MTKFDKYQDLVRQRKACQACLGVSNPSFSKFDSDELGPWTAWQGNLDAPLMIVGQDWGDFAGFEQARGFDDDFNPTCRNLITLLDSIGITIEPPSSGQHCPSRGDVLLTNAALCLKGGGAQGDVDDSWFGECGRRFLRPLFGIASPRIVVTLGTHAYRAMGFAINLPVSKKTIRLRDLVERPEGLVLPCGARWFPVYHCGSKITNMTRSLPQQLNDWEKIGIALAATKPSQT